MQVRRKDAGIFKDGAVLNDVFVALAYFYHFFKALVKNIFVSVVLPLPMLPATAICIVVFCYLLLVGRMGKIASILSVINLKSSGRVL